MPHHRFLPYIHLQARPQTPREGCGALYSKGRIAAIFPCKPSTVLCVFPR